MPTHKAEKGNEKALKYKTKIINKIALITTPDGFDLPCSFCPSLSYTNKLKVQCLSSWFILRYNSFVPYPTLFTFSITSKTKQQILHDCILTKQEKIHNIKTQFCGDSCAATIQSGELHFLKLFGFGFFIYLFIFKVSGKFPSDWCARYLIRDAGKWVEPFGSHSNAVLLTNEKAFRHFAIILSPLQIYFRDFKGRTFLEIKWLGRSKGRNIPKGQMSSTRYWTMTTAVTHIQTAYLGVPRQQLCQYLKSISHNA